MNPGVRTEPSSVGAVTIRENKLSLVERLADDLAHEIKNPLHSMVINLEVLRRRLVKLGLEPSSDLLRYASVISTELDRVNRRVDLLLRMVRPQRDAEDFTTIGEVLEELQELIQLETERHEVVLDMDVPDAVIRADLPRASTRQMILSLLLGVLDEAAPGSRLHVHTEVGPGIVRLHAYLGGSDGTSRVLPAIAENSTFLTVARSIAESLGGNLEQDSHPDGLPSQDSSATAPNAGYLLTIPR